jgi:signal transduction histidine kinase
MARDKEFASAINWPFSRLRLYVAYLFVFLALLQVIIYLGLIAGIWGESLDQWLPELVISTVILVAGGIGTLLLVTYFERQARTHALQTLERELRELRIANSQINFLQAMASTLSATLSFERVMEIALDVSFLALTEMDLPADSLSGAVFLYDGNELEPVAARRFVSRDYEKRLPGQSGVIGKALKQAEPAVTSNPAKDPELHSLVAFQGCQTVVCLPLRASYRIYGAIILGTAEVFDFEERDLELLTSIADQSVVALQHAQLYQDLADEKRKIIEAEEAARTALARALHDGPTQNVATIAMRIALIRSILSKNPERANQELSKVEDLARQSSRELRDMLFTLRPMVLERQGLGAAIETAVNKIRESNGLNVRLEGRDYGDLLSDEAGKVVFYILDEALNNAHKYAKAGQIEVRLWRENNWFMARVADDGVGFDVESAAANSAALVHLGLVHMRERAERIDGSIKVESKPDQGTTIILAVPLDRHGQQEAARLS